ncbi:hypothetical protein MA9V2_180 [Chryseobacterium phage MA9V-2]|nr:hypothetical protein MA9V2_180 [Chryseobacterium phage MA9V-2]
MSEQAFKQTFNADTVSEDLATNIDSISSTFAKNMAANSDALFEIIDQLVDTKLSTATIIPKLGAPSGGGPVTGVITITGT